MTGMWLVSHEVTMDRQGMPLSLRPVYSKFQRRPGAASDVSGGRTPFLGRVQVPYTKGPHRPHQAHLVALR